MVQLVERALDLPLDLSELLGEVLGLMAYDAGEPSYLVRLFRKPVSFARIAHLTTSLLRSMSRLIPCNLAYKGFTPRVGKLSPCNRISVSPQRRNLAR